MTSSRTATNIYIAARFRVNVLFNVDNVQEADKRLMHAFVALYQAPFFAPCLWGVDVVWPKLHLHQLLTSVFFIKLNSNYKRDNQIRSTHKYFLGHSSAK
jgi:hypothetical protein